MLAGKELIHQVMQSTMGGRVYKQSRQVQLAWQRYLPRLDQPHETASEKIGKDDGLKIEQMRRNRDPKQPKLDSLIALHQHPLRNHLKNSVYL
jgi:hypothetical protein